MQWAYFSTVDEAKNFAFNQYGQGVWSCIMTDDDGIFGIGA